MNGRAENAAIADLDTEAQARIAGARCVTICTFQGPSNEVRAYAASAAVSVAIAAATAMTGDIDFMVLAPDESVSWSAKRMSGGCPAMNFNAA
jgi:hypothetical protein